MRQGDFSGLPVIFDPAAASDGQRQPFFGNQEPVSRIDPVAAALLAQTPLPNLPGIAQNLRAVGNESINGNQYSARFDHQLAANDALWLRTSLFDIREADPFGSSVLQESLLPGFGRELSTHAINGVASWSHGFSANSAE